MHLTTLFTVSNFLEFCFENVMKQVLTCNTYMYVYTCTSALCISTHLVCYMSPFFLLVGIFHLPCRQKNVFTICLVIKFFGCPPLAVTLIPDVCNGHKSGRSESQIIIPSMVISRKPPRTFIFCTVESVDPILKMRY